MNATAKTTVADLTEGQLYDEANALGFARHRGTGLSEQQIARLAALEAEFAVRHAAALAAA